MSGRNNIRGGLIWRFGIVILRRRFTTMIKYIAIAATENKIIENWGGTSKFSNQAISGLAKSAKNKLIFLDFDTDRQIGKIISAENLNGKLSVIFEINHDHIIDNRQRLVPGFVVDVDSWDENENHMHRIIKKAESVGYGLTYNPAERDLPEIKKHNEN